MSSNVSAPEVAAPKDVENRIPLTAQAALFNPVPEVREKALKQLRASSPYNPDMWERFDEATGVKSDKPSMELTADSSLTVDSWAEYSNMVLDDQFVSSTIVDQLMAAGFGVNSSLARYAYFNSLSAARMEAETGMNLRTRSEQDLPGHGLDGVPMPLHIVTYQIDAREYQNAQAFGEDFDTANARSARRALNRSESQMLWQGWGRDVQTERGLLSVGGLDDDTQDQILAGTASGGWITDPNNILADVAELHDTVEDQSDVVSQDDVPLVSEVGGWVFVPRGMWGEFTREDYETSATDEPIIDRLERKYPYLNFTPAPRLDSDSLIMVLDDPRYFQIVNAQSVTNTSWTSDGGAALNNRLLSSRTPFIRRQPDGIAGIARITGIDA